MPSSYATSSKVLLDDHHSMPPVRPSPYPLTSNLGAPVSCATSTSHPSTTHSQTGNNSTSYLGGLLGSRYMPHAVEARLSVLLAAFEGGGGMASAPMAKEGNESGSSTSGFHRVEGVHSSTSTSTNTPSTSPWLLPRFTTPPSDFQCPYPTSSHYLPSTPHSTPLSSSTPVSTLPCAQESVTDMPKTKGKGMEGRRATFGHFDPSRDPRLLGI